MKNKKGFTLVEIMIVVVIIGLLAAMAVPAFNQVRQNSRVSAIENNLRQVAGGGQQYLLEAGLPTANYTSIVDVYFPAIAAVAGETYTGLTISQGGGTLTVTMSDGVAVTYAY